MTLRIFFYLFFAITISTGCSTKVLVKSKWQQEPIKSDGLINEWIDDMTYDSKSKILYSLANDDKNLYVSLKITDIDKQVEILTSGLTLKVKSLEKKAETFGVIFPRKLNAFQLDQLRISAANVGIQKSKRQLFQSLNTFEVLGLEKDPVVADNFNIKGILMYVSIDSLDIMGYEALIPLNMLTSDVAGMLSDTTNSLALSVKTGGISQADAAQAANAGSTGVDVTQNGQQGSNDLTYGQANQQLQDIYGTRRPSSTAQPLDTRSTPQSPNEINLSVKFSLSTKGN